MYMTCPAFGGSTVSPRFNAVRRRILPPPFLSFFDPFPSVFVSILPPGAFPPLSATFLVPCTPPSREGRARRRAKAIRRRFADTPKWSTQPTVEASRFIRWLTPRVQDVSFRGLRVQVHVGEKGCSKSGGATRGLDEKGNGTRRKTWEMERTPFFRRCRGWRWWTRTGTSARWKEGRWDETKPRQAKQMERFALLRRMRRSGPHGSVVAALHLATRSCVGAHWRMPRKLGFC